jgi:radical SAM/Cys-rich protein
MKVLETQPHPWKSRGDFPHFEGKEVIQAVTFRLDDSVPGPLVRTWKEELRITDETTPSDPCMAKLRERITCYEDEGHGACWLRDPVVARIVEEALLHFDGERYRLLAWCIMPNHVHVLVETGERWPLAGLLQRWKSVTARAANKYLDRTGAFWQREYFDRFILHEKHLAAAADQIAQNPVKAGLVEKPEDWPWLGALASVRHSVTPPSLGSVSSESRPEAGAPRSFPATLHRHGLALRRGVTEILQINTGKLCNLTCVHCHVNAGPKRKEIMTRATMDRVLAWLAGAEIHTIDLTGGAPEMIPDFCYLIERLRELPQVETIIDRCNLTILNESGYEEMAGFLARHRVEIVASMPCYSPENVNEQRGDGVFDSSIEGLRKLNRLGYGTDPKLPLHLVYNPNGDFLPPEQSGLEAAYKRELENHFGIVFNRLYCITNMPIARYKSWLKNNGKLEAYMELLRDAFNPGAVAGVMCRNTLSVGWEGEVFDCDFNQQLGIPWADEKVRYLWDIDVNEIVEREIALADHCFGCTAGAGSSCQGAVA